MNFRLGELFCGPGGIALAAKQAAVSTGSSVYSVSHAWATDYDSDTCQTFRQNICPENPETVICDDIRNLELQTLKEISEIDALAFGFPCNDFSIVGERKGVYGVFGPLYEYGVKALKYFKPDWFLAENVGGLKYSYDGNSLNGKFFSRILEELYKAGYEPVPHLYKFEQYGVPQARHRIIIVGIRRDLKVHFKVPSPEDYQNIDISCKNAITNPPIPQDAPNNEPTRQSVNVMERLKFIEPGKNAFNTELPDHLRLNVKGATISQIYRRLEASKPSYTVTGSGGGGTHVYHWEENRALTNRERARLQTFPDDFIFYGSKEKVRRQVGMAVPPQGAKVIIEAVLKSFAGIEYKFIEPNLRHEKTLLSEFV